MNMIKSGDLEFLATELDRDKYYMIGLKFTDKELSKEFMCKKAMYITRALNNKEITKFILYPYDDLDIKELNIHAILHLLDIVKKEDPENYKKFIEKEYRKLFNE